MSDNLKIDSNGFELRPTPWN